MSDIKTLASVSATAFSLSEYKNAESTKATKDALGDKPVPVYATYQDYMGAWKAVYMAEADVNAKAANSAWSRHFAACGYDKAPAIPADQAAKGTVERTAARAKAKKATEALIKKFQSPEALRDEAAKAVKAGNTAAALQFSRAADVLGKKVISSQDETRKDLMAQIGARVRVCHDLTILRQVLALLPVLELKAVKAAKAPKGGKPSISLTDAEIALASSVA